MNDSLSLYEIEDGLRAVMDELADASEEAATATESSEALVRVEQAKEAVKAYLTEEVRKVNGIAGYIRYCDAMAEQCSAEVRRIARMQQAWANRAAWVKDMTLGVMRVFDKKKLETGTSYLRRQSNGGTVAPIITDPAKVPAKYVRVLVQMTEQQWMAMQSQYTLDGHVVKAREFMTGEIGKALANGETVPGAEPGQRGEHLRVA